MIISIYRNCDNHLNPSPYPIFLTTEHMYNSIGRKPAVALSALVSLPYVWYNPSWYLRSSSEAALPRSILFPNTRNGTLANSSDVNKASNSFFASGNLSLSTASTRNTTPSTPFYYNNGDYCGN